MEGTNEVPDSDEAASNATNTETQPNNNEECSKEVAALIGDDELLMGDGVSEDCLLAGSVNEEDKIDDLDSMDEDIVLRLEEEDHSDASDESPIMLSSGDTTNIAVLSYMPESLHVQDDIHCGMNISEINADIDDLMGSNDILPEDNDNIIMFDEDKEDVFNDLTTIIENQEGQMIDGCAKPGSVVIESTAKELGADSMREPVSQVQEVDERGVGMMTKSDKMDVTDCDIGDSIDPVGNVLKEEGINAISIGSDSEIIKAAVTSEREEVALNGGAPLTGEDNRETPQGGACDISAENTALELGNIESKSVCTEFSAETVDNIVHIPVNNNVFVACSQTMRDLKPDESSIHFDLPLPKVSSPGSESNQILSLSEEDFSLMKGPSDADLSKRHEEKMEESIDDFSPTSVFNIEQSPIPVDATPPTIDLRSPHATDLRSPSVDVAPTIPTDVILQAIGVPSPNLIDVISPSMDISSPPSIDVRSPICVTSPISKDVTFPNLVGETSPAMGVASPPTSVTSPPMGVASPPMVVASPPMSATSPFMGVTSPHMSVASPPMGETSPPMGVASPPMSATSPSMGVKSPPMGVASPPMYVASPPMGVTSPAMSVTSLPMGVTSPDMSVPSPHTDVTSPPMSVASPHMGVTSPHMDVASLPMGVTSPHMGVTSPDMSVTSPHTDVTSPPMGVASPHVGVTSPHMDVASLHMGVTSPLMSVSSPHMGVTSLPMGVTSLPMGVPSSHMSATSLPMSATFPPMCVPFPPIGVTSPPTCVTSPHIVVTSPPMSVTSAHMGVACTPMGVASPHMAVASSPMAVPSPPMSVPSPHMGVTSHPMGVKSPAMGVASPHMGVTSPPMVVASPPMSATSPFMGVTSPHMSVASPPMGETSPPMGVASPPMSATSPSMGVKSPPMGVASPPMYVASPPMGVTSPAMSVTSLPMGVTSPDMSVPSPHTDVTSPPMSVASPHMGVTSPPMVVASPPMSATSPFMGVTSPHMSVASPPMGETSPPMGVASPPMSATSPSMGVKSPPMGVASPPMYVSSLPMSVPSPPMSVPSPHMGVTSPPMGVKSPAMGVTSPHMRVTSRHMGVTFPPTGVTSPPMVVTSPPMSVTSAPMGVTSPPMSVTSPIVDLPSTPMGVTSPHMGVTSPPMSVASSPMGVVTSPIVDVKFPPMGVTSPAIDLTSPLVGVKSPSIGVTSPPIGLTFPTIDLTSPLISETLSVDNTPSLDMNYPTHMDEMPIPVTPEEDASVGITTPFHTDEILSIDVISPSIGVTSTAPLDEIPPIGVPSPIHMDKIPSMHMTLPSIGMRTLDPEDEIHSVGAISPTPNDEIPVVDVTSSPIDVTSPTVDMRSLPTQVEDHAISEHRIDSSETSRGDNSGDFLICDEDILMNEGTCNDDMALEDESFGAEHSFGNVSPPKTSSANGETDIALHNVDVGNESMDCTATDGGVNGTGIGELDDEKMDDLTCGISGARENLDTTSIQTPSLATDRDTSVNIGIVQNVLNSRLIDECDSCKESSVPDDIMLGGKPGAEEEVDSTSEGVSQLVSFKANEAQEHSKTDNNGLNVDDDSNDTLPNDPDDLIQRHIELSSFKDITVVGSSGKPICEKEETSPSKPEDGALKEAKEPRFVADLDIDMITTEDVLDLAATSELSLKGSFAEVTLSKLAGSAGEKNDTSDVKDLGAWHSGSEGLVNLKAIFDEEDYRSGAGVEQDAEFSCDVRMLHHPEDASPEHSPPGDDFNPSASTSTEASVFRAPVDDDDTIDCPSYSKLDTDVEMGNDQLAAATPNINGNDAAVAVEEDEDAEFVWEEYLEETDTIAAPPTAFSHVERSLQSGFERGMKVEVANKNPADTYWVATIIMPCGQLLRLRHEGRGDDGSSDFWCDVLTSDIHALGWCEEQGKTLQIPPELSEKVPDAVELAAKLCREAETVPGYLLDGSTGSTPIDQIKEGMLLDVQHVLDLSLVWTARIIENVGGRLLLRYEGDTASHDFWLFYLNPRLHPIGWGRNKGLDYKPPAEILKDDRTPDEWASVLQTALQEAEKLVMPSGVFKEPPPLPEHSFQEGWRLEAVHPHDPTQICPATVSKVIDPTHFIVTLDDLSASKKKVEMCCDATTVTILPVSWASSNGLHVTCPNGWSDADFDWVAYLENTGAEKAPDTAFTQASDHQFECDMRLEAVTPGKEGQISVATISRVEGALLWIHLDCQTQMAASLIVAAYSHSIFPVGWCESNNYPLRPPLHRFRRRKPVAENNIEPAQNTSNSKNDSSKPGLSGSCWCPKIYFNHRCFSGPYLSKGRIAELPKCVGPGPVTLVMKEVLTMLINVAYKSSRVLRELQMDSSEVHSDMHQQVLKAKYKGKSYRALVQLCKSSEQVGEFCRSVCLQLECCPNLFSPMLISGACPEYCFQLTKTKYTYTYGKKKKRKIGRPPGGHSNLEFGPKKPGKRRKRKRFGCMPRRKHDSVDSDDTNQSAELLHDVNPPGDNMSIGSRDDDDDDDSSECSLKKKRKYQRRQLPPPSEMKTRGAKLPNFSFGERRTRKKATCQAPLPPPPPPPPPPPKVHIPLQQESHVSAFKTVSSKRDDEIPILETNPIKWSVRKVVNFLKTTDCANMARTFREQEIDGQAFLLLNLPTVQEHMDLKLGPAVKLCHHIERVKIAFFEQYSR